jgi:hypothetical protein
MFNDTFFPEKQEESFKFAHNIIHFEKYCFRWISRLRAFWVGNNKTHENLMSIQETLS